MKNILQHKLLRNKKKYFKSKHLEKPHVPPIFLFYISILRYQFPNGMVNKICNFLTFFLPIIFRIPLWTRNNQLNSINERIGPMVTLLKKSWWPKGLVVHCNRVGELVVGGRWRTYRWIDGRLSVVNGFVIHFTVSPKIRFHVNF